jgi:acetylglutamate kinase
LRYTDAASIKVVKQTLNGEINDQICKTIEDAGGVPAPTPGQRVFSCEKLAVDLAGDPVDLGFVGSITSVSPFEVKAPLSERRIPVISCIAADGDGHAFNTNADVAAAHLASSLGARRLVYLCDVPGLLQNPQDPASLISTLPIGDIERLKSSGIISSGMVPKVDGAAHAIREGVRRVHFVDANQPHSLLLEIFTHTGIGTELVLD